MILRVGAHVLSELHDELARKTLALWNSRSSKTYDHYVPWMSCLPEADEVLIDHPALSEYYERGALLSSPEQLHNLNEYLQLAQAERIALNLFKGFVTEEANSPIAQKVVDKCLIEGFCRAKRAVIETHPLFETLFDRLVHVVIPLRFNESQMNGSLDLARGAIFISLAEPVDDWNLQLDLAHEFGHQVLMILNSADPLFKSDLEAPVYSGVRLTDRPALQSLHAATALAFMTLFARGKTDSVARQETATMVIELSRTIASLRQNCVMTELGQTILDDYQWLCEEVQPSHGGALSTRIR